MYVPGGARNVLDPARPCPPTSRTGVSCSSHFSIATTSPGDGLRPPPFTI